MAFGGGGGLREQERQRERRKRRRRRIRRKGKRKRKEKKNTNSNSSNKATPPVAYADAGQRSLRNVVQETLSWVPRNCFCCGHIVITTIIHTCQNLLQAEW